MGRYVVGIDVGGTNLKLGLVDPSGKVLSRTNFATKTFMRSQKDLIDAIVQGSEELLAENSLKKKDILGVGIGLPGPVNFSTGVVNVLTNIPGWRNVPLKKICEKKIGLKVFIDNDVHVMALGEWRFGAGIGIKNLVCLTIGTGVGGGLILDNKLYRGESWSAGEVGHLPLNEKGPACNCGGYGCFERYVGKYALQKKAAKIFRNKKIRLEEVDELAGKKDPRALAFWEEVAIHVGNGLIGVVNVLNPRRIIIGGGIANAHQHFLSKVNEIIKTRAMKIPASVVKVVKAGLGTDAGIIGAQVLVHDAVGGR